MEISPGLCTYYEYNDKTHFATALNTFEDENGNSMATLCLSGIDKIIVTNNNFDTIINPGSGGGSNIQMEVVDGNLIITLN